MQIVLYADNTLPIAIQPLAEMLNSVCASISFTVGQNRFRINTPEVSRPTSYEQLQPALVEEAGQFDLAFLCTNVFHQNNYFYHGYANKTIISFNGWNLLTDLSITNGLVYFIAAIVAQRLGIGNRHDENTGCINDVLWNKTGVDAGMRAAFICADCLNAQSLEAIDSEVINDIERLLDIVSTASRARTDVLAMHFLSEEYHQEIFDVFLCHNSEDKPIIRRVNTALRNAGINTWFDEEQLEPGLPWQAELERQIGNVRKAAVFVGENGFGPWQNMEVRSFLSEFVSRGVPVIPIILPNAQATPELPIFLRQMMWLDLRDDYDSNILRLIGAIQRR
jgi:TIR domain